MVDTDTRLPGKRCASCQVSTLEAVNYCPNGCGATVVDTSFSPEGTVYASTTIHVPAPNLSSPYRVAYVDLADGPRVFGHLATSEAVELGSAVRVIRHERPVDQAGPYVRFQFVAAGSAEGETR